jgi:hypothetical protein
MPDRFSSFPDPVEIFVMFSIVSILALLYIRVDSWIGTPKSKLSDSGDVELQL